MKTKTLTTGQITSLALGVLELKRYKCWRQNNVVAVRGRTFTGQRGLTDICGYQRFTGQAMYCEVKNTGDKLSEAQITFLNNAKMSGCACFIATVDKNNGFELKEY
jgi:hypothetical protein